VAVDEALKPTSFQRCIELVGEVQIVAAVGDEDAKLVRVGRVGSARLLRSYISWVRRSRVDTGWRDHIDLPLGESREAWRITLSPPIPGIGPWESATSAWAIDAAELAAVPARHMIEIRQAGDFALSPPLSLPLT